MKRIRINKNDLISYTKKLAWRDDENESRGGSVMYDGSALTITFSDNVHIEDGDIVFRRYVNGETVSESNCEILEVLGENSCKVSIPQRYIMSVTDKIETIDAISGDTYYAYTFSDNVGVYREDLVEYAENGKDYTFTLTDEQGESYVYSDITCVWGEDGTVPNEYDGDEIFDNQQAKNKLCSKSTYDINLLPCSVAFCENQYFWIKDQEDDEVVELRDANVVEDDENEDELREVELWNGVEIEYSHRYVKFPIELNTSEETGLMHEELVNSEFVDDVINNVVPETIDMEKVAFVPYNPYNGAKKFINQIQFRFHFRVRETDSEGKYTQGWSIVEDGLWNNLEDITDALPTTSDSVKYLNFDSEDIYYQKQKVSKSFIRLSFYDSADITAQQLLGYSTVFLDGGELYGKYLEALNKVKDDEDPLDFVTTEINIFSNSNMDKSSEGFYIYLFPSELDDSGNGMIYMKVEFNHAGYGRTIPFLRPKFKGEYPYSQPVTVSEFFTHEFIPIHIARESNSGKYIYYVDNSVLYDSELYPNAHGIYCEDDLLSFNLVETKLTNTEPNGEDI